MEETRHTTGSEATPPTVNLDWEKFRLEQSRYRTELLKWVVVAIGAVLSFLVIDYGRLSLEKYKVSAEVKRELLKAYLDATDTPQPEVWKRKLQVLQNFSDDAAIQKWAEAEFAYIDSFAAIDALYRETLKMASQLVEPDRLADPDRIKARVRYNQLYWADLPYAGESEAVITAMVAFRKQLLATEGAPSNKNEWDTLNVRLIDLSRALRESTPRNPTDTK